MKTTLLALTATGAALLLGCSSAHYGSAPHSTRTARTQPPNNPANGYDDRQIAKIQRGETTEAQLLEWFGLPESRQLNPDGRAHLSWAFSRRTDGGPGTSGILDIRLAPKGTVEAYSAHGGPAETRRTVEFVEKSDTDIRERMNQWSREGWRVLGVSGRLRQADGTIHRKADLARGDSGNTSFGYDDHRLALIRRSETTGTQLLEWFGPAYSRNLDQDGRAQLTWNFSTRTDGGPGNSGELNASLASDGTVAAYSAHRGP